MQTQERTKKIHIYKLRLHFGRKKLSSWSGTKWERLTDSIEIVTRDLHSVVIMYLSNPIHFFERMVVKAERAWWSWLNLLGLLWGFDSAQCAWLPRDGSEPQNLEPDIYLKLLKGSGCSDLGFGLSALYRLRPAAKFRSGSKLSQSSGVWSRLISSLWRLVNTQLVKNGLCKRGQEVEARSGGK